MNKQSATRGKPASYYDVLEVSPQASDAQVKRAYHMLAKQSHPDFNPNNEMAARQFKLISAAYRALATQDARLRYNEALRQKRAHLARKAQVMSANNDNLQAKKSWFTEMVDIFWPIRTSRHM